MFSNKFVLILYGRMACEDIKNNLRGSRAPAFAPLKMKGCRKTQERLRDDRKKNTCPQTSLKCSPSLKQADTSFSSLSSELLHTSSDLWLIKDKSKCLISPVLTHLSLVCFSEDWRPLVRLCLFVCILQHISLQRITNPISSLTTPSLRAHFLKCTNVLYLSHCSVVDANLFKRVYLCVWLIAFNQDTLLEVLISFCLVYSSTLMFPI